MLSAYYELLTSDNEIARMSAAKAWSIWEGRCSTLDPNGDMVDHFADPHVALAMARIEAHYFINHAFMEENQLLDNTDRIQHIPTVIVHGRYDMVCPIEQAFALQQKLPQAELHIVRDAGHSAFEPGITDNLVAATDQLCPLPRLTTPPAQEDLGMFRSAESRYNAPFSASGALPIMKALIQRVSHASVTVDGECTGAIDQGDSGTAWRGENR